jgi:plastocyanin
MSNLLRYRRWRVLLAMLVVVLAGSSVAALAAPTKTRTVRVGDIFFSVKKMTIKKGTRVTWNWVGYLNHNVTVKKGPVKFHSGTQARGSYSHRFKRKGVYHLFCTLHPWMKMTIVVK